MLCIPTVFFAQSASLNHCFIRHILPNSLPPVIVLTSLRMATVLLTAAALGFLGLGVQPPLPEWGAMLANARDYLFDAPHVALASGLAIRWS